MAELLKIAFCHVRILNLVRSVPVDGSIGEIHLVDAHVAVPVELHEIARRYPEAVVHDSCGTHVKIVPVLASHVADRSATYRSEVSLPDASRICQREMQVPAEYYDLGVFPENRGKGIGCPIMRMRRFPYSAIFAQKASVDCPGHHRMGEDYHILPWVFFGESLQARVQPFSSLCVIAYWLVSVRGYCKNMDATQNGFPAFVILAHSFVCVHKIIFGTQTVADVFCRSDHVRWPRIARHLMIPDSVEHRDLHRIEDGLVGILERIELGSAVWRIDEISNHQNPIQPVGPMLFCHGIALVQGILELIHRTDSLA